MGLSEPQIVSKPFSHLKEAINTIAEYQVDDKLVDPTKETKKWIDAAIKGFEEGKGFEALNDAQKGTIDSSEMVRKIRDVWVHGRFDQIDDISDDIISSGIVEANEYLAFALNNWGVDLSKLAKTKEGKEADDLFKQSFKKYEQALKIKPDKHEALNNWGTALSELAKTKEGKEADDLLKQSFEKYERALKIKPDKHETLDNWGHALSDLAKTKEGKEADDLFKQAFKKLMKAEEIKEGTAAYNISCIYALTNKIKESLIWLEKSLKMKSTPSRKHILADSDLDKIKSTNEFRNLISRYRPE